MEARVAMSEGDGMIQDDIAVRISAREPSKRGMSSAVAGRERSGVSRLELVLQRMPVVRAGRYGSPGSPVLRPSFVTRRSTSR